jgi:NADPH-dependent glutamate synthase beta subunit-like oxidoreductase/NAD(P)H-flavin reductase
MIRSAKRLSEVIMPNPSLKLKNADFKDLFDPAWLAAQDAQFLTYLQQQDAGLHTQLLAYRSPSSTLSPAEVSSLLIACAPLLEIYIAELFDIETAVAQAAQATFSDQPIFAFKQGYVQRQARRRLTKLEEVPPFSVLQQWLEEALAKNPPVAKNKNATPPFSENIPTPWPFEGDIELAVALLGASYLQNPEVCAAEIEQLICWCVRVLTDVEAQAYVKDWVSFQLPHKRDYAQLVPLYPVPEDSISRMESAPSQHRSREGFELTDPRFTPRQVLSEIDYCVYCHDKEGDFCSKGFPVKKGEPALGLKKNPLGDILTGCPLEEKISEMHVLKKEGYPLGALAVIMVDNPMCPMTGHRICNDCMKACIYQKQDPVNIPQVETGVLMDVLCLPWGVEIYDLLTRWNPLRPTQWVAKPYNGLKVLVMGMGPAGFSLAHHLLMEGCAVVGADGLKIEPLPENLQHQPIYHYDDIKEALDTRVMAGFGGVAEYGITVRWDKNFLKLIYISLMRRPHFQVFGGVRFGGTLTVEDSWALGFDHLAVAVGAGLPKALPIPNSMAPGMRQANDFLMALQLTGAAKKSSLANLQVRLPAVVIGGGLTGIDTATEVQAYYIAQIEKTYQQYHLLAQTLGEARLREQFDAQSLEILDEFIAHALQAHQERALAATEKRLPNFIPLLRSWGGVTIAYRRLLRESPAYLRNHEEVAKALEEGIYYAEGLAPKTVRLNTYGHVSALTSESHFYDEKGEWVMRDEEHVLPAHSIFVATGAAPNVAYEFEHQGTFLKKQGVYETYDAAGKLEPIPAEHHVKMPEFGAFTSYHLKDKRVTFLGDTHPIFHGSVVKAIASAKRTYPEIVQLWGARTDAAGDAAEYHRFAQKIQQQFEARVVNVTRHTSSVVELKVQAPLAAHNYKPGHFYRVQNFETHAQNICLTKTSAADIENTLLQTESTALLASHVDKTAGTLSFMVLEHGVSSRLFATLKKDDPIVVMGPTGVRTRISEEKETVLIIGGRLSAAQLLSVGTALRAAGNTVLYFGGFKTAAEVFCQPALEAAADKIIWVAQHGERIHTNRPQDHSTQGDVISALEDYAKGAFDIGGMEIPLHTVQRVLLIGKFPFLRAMQHAKHTRLKNYFSPDAKWVASVYGPMQCMLKGVCAQCLVWQIDPITQKRTKAVFACSWHDQPFELVDVNNLEERLAQNKMQETLGNLWLDYLFTQQKVERV